MGRAGTWFEYQREGIVPDVAVVAKVLTAGHMPLGGLVAREEVAAAFQGGQAAFIAATTLGGTPLACAAALATIEVWPRRAWLERAPASASAPCRACSSCRRARASSRRCAFAAP